MINLENCLVLDLETTGQGTKKKKAYGRISNPFLEDSELNVYAECRYGQKPSIVFDYEQDIRPFLDINLNGIDIIIGQNIKFDMTWLWKHPQIIAFFARGGRLYDTMIAEYFLRGHDSRAFKQSQLNLDALSKKYGGEQKPDKIKEYWEQGLTTKDIGRLHHDELIYYAAGDVTNIWPIIEGQIKYMKLNGMLNAFMVYMEDLAAMIETEVNGLKIDQELGAIREQEVEELITPMQERLTALVSGFWPKEISFNPSSGKQLSAALFGGECGKYKVDEPVLDELGEPVRFKGGKRKGEIKTKKAERIGHTEGFRLPSKGFKKTANGYSVDKEALPKVLRIEAEDNGWVEFVETLIEIKKYEKLLNNYYRGEKGPLKNTYPDGFARPNFNHTTTTTGRLSCGSPNAQNTDKATKELIVSRWGEDGVIVSIDYSGQEIVVEAGMTGCKQKLEDVANGLDPHLLNATIRYNKDYEEWAKLKEEGNKEVSKERNEAKPITFGLAYGEGPEALARKLGCPVEDIERIVEGNKKRYPEIYLHHEIILQELERTQELSDDLMPIQLSKKRSNKPLPDGFYFKKEHDVSDKFCVRNDSLHLSYGYHTNVFGQKWKYPKYGALTNRNEVFEYFSGPMVQNYYVQGTSALVTKLASGMVFYKHAQYHRDTMAMVNQVHDEIVFDIKKEALDLHLPKLCAIMEDVENELSRRYNMKVTLPLKVDYSYGRSWLDAKESE